MNLFDYRKYIFFDIITYIICLALMMILRPDIGLIIAIFGLVTIIILTKRYILLKFISISFIMAFLWQVVGGKEYFYGKDFWTLYGINIYPLLAWTIGLFVVYMVFFYVYENIFGTNKKVLKKPATKLFLFMLFYWIVLIVAETLAFHVFGFKNLGGANYAGLPICDCIHSPHWMQAVYLSMGPIYITIIYLFKSRRFYELFRGK